MKRSSFAVLAVAVLLHQGAVSADAQPPDALKFFKNYFVTGDYVVAGVGLQGTGANGVATGSLRVGERWDAASARWVADPASRVPAGADVLAAFLYWQVVAKESAGGDAAATGVTFRGYSLSPADGPYGKILGEGSPPCWSGGGGTGSSGGTNRTYTVRADVLRFFDVDAAGEFIVNGSHQVQLPDDSGAAALGASLVIVYRDPSKPLRAIVLYDGGYTMAQQQESMAQTIRGFYQAAVDDAKLTHIVGSGQANKSERLYLNGVELALNPFRSSAGPAWDNPTFTLVPAAYPGLAGFSQSPAVTTSVDHAGFNSFDCLTWAAVVYRTDVKDTDGDGLLDVWEVQKSDSPASLLRDPNGVPLPVLGDMGAKPGVKDLFIEVGYMRADADPSTDAWPSYGGVSMPPHDHLPSADALELMARAFKRAPVSNPDGSSGINVHFDVGPHHQPAFAPDPGQCEDLTTWSLGCAVIPAAQARGGESVNEMDTAGCSYVEGTDPPWKCQFKGHPGTVGWKTGFRYLRDEVLADGAGNAPSAGDGCELPGNTCVRRFDANRRDMFHYAFFAHAIGLPKSPLPCLDANGIPVSTNSAALCDVATNPDFRVPRTNTGVGDFPGGDVLVTLGGFPDAAGKPIGTPFMQASTLLHELGHNLELRHGGRSGDPNCKPTYLSVMNYLYQLRGLLDDDGKPHLDFSADVFDPLLDERELTDGYPALVPLPYRIGWYAPLATSYLNGRALAARRHCDGSELLETDVPMVRIDARAKGGAVDWKANGQPESAALDVNFNGRATDQLAGFDDWASINLNQVGSRRNVAGLYVDQQGRPTFGALSIDMGRLDLGRLDLGRLDLGRLDLGRLDLGRLDLGRLDLGHGDLGQGDLGRLDLGRLDLGRLDLGRLDLGRLDLGRGDEGRGDKGGGDLFVGDPENPGGELDFDAAGDLAKTPPNEFRACVLGADPACLCPEGQLCGLNQVRSDFKASNIGGVLSYQAYCVAGPAIVPDTPGTPWIPAGSALVVPGQLEYFLVGGSPLRRGTYTCFATATYGDNVLSDPSNLRTIVAVNSPPVAANPTVVTNEDTAVAVTLPGSDADGDPLGYEIVANPSHGSVAGSGASWTYTPAADFFGVDAFSYSITDGQGGGASGIVTITVTAVNDAPVAVGDSYSAPGGSSLTIGAPGVLGNDTDIDGPSLTAVVVSGPSAGTLGLNGDGSFTYTPSASFVGLVTFTYRAFDGTAYSLPATVTIAVQGQAYSFYGLQNAPPAAITKTKAGSAVPMKWQFRDGSTAVDSSQVRHEVTVRGPLPDGPIRTVTNTDPGSSSFRYDASTSTWTFNLQTKEANGKSYPVGDYEVTITPTSPGYLASPTFPLKLTK